MTDKAIKQIEDFAELIRSHAMFVQARCVDGKIVAEDMRAAARHIKRPCLWTFGEMTYETKCGFAFAFIDDGISENGFEFCPFCGGKIEAGGNIHG